MINECFFGALEKCYLQICQSYAANSSTSVLNILLQSDNLFIMHNAINSAMTVFEHVFMRIVIDRACSAADCCQANQNFLKQQQSGVRQSHPQMTFPHPTTITFLLHYCCIL